MKLKQQKLTYRPLFKTVLGRPMRFYLFSEVDTDAGSKLREDLANDIKVICKLVYFLYYYSYFLQRNGGLIHVNSLNMLNDPYCISLCCDVKEKENFEIEDFIEYSKRELFDSQFIIDSLSSAKLQDLNIYR